MVFGRIIGAIIGWLVAGPITAVIGFIAGFFFDKGLKGVNRGFDPQHRAMVERALFAAVFPVLGRLAKADGRISEEEVAGTEHLMSRMGLSSEARREAITLFKEGAKSDYDIQATIDSFLASCGQYNNVKQIFIVYLITIAYADGVLHEAEERLLQEIADRLGYSRFAFNHLLGMIKAQSYFYQGQQEQAGYRGERTYQDTRRSSQNDIALAYQALGVSADVSDGELKKAYRRLMSEYHPDKLAGSGVPEDMVKLATERSQEIQAAYDLLKKHRRS